MTTYRNDGLDNPCSPNSGGLRWADVVNCCEESDAVDSFDETDGGIEITWCDGNREHFSNPASAINAIDAMSAT